MVKMTGMGPTDNSEITILTREECFNRLAEVPVGRISVSIDALPVIFPVHFALEDESVLFRTVRGTKLDTAATDAVVAFQADASDSRAGGWWSVLLQGIATPVRDGEEETQTWNPAPWHGAGRRQPKRLLRIDTDAMRGRFFRDDLHLPDPDSA